MPIKRRLERERPPQADALAQQLETEWARPRMAGEPVIVLEGPEGEPSHVYVLWNRWEGLRQADRSEIIMDVAERHLDVPSAVTVAMGLTFEEAERMGIKAN